MFQKSIYSFIIFFILFQAEIFSQGKIVELPVNYTNYFESPLLTSPSDFGYKDATNLDFGYSGYSGIRKNNNDSYLLLDYYSVKKNTSGNKFGLLFQRTQNGKYISRNRIYFNYAHRLILSDIITLSAGARVGIYNSFISDNPSGISGSAFAPDGAVGISLTIKHLIINLSLHQIFDGKLQPIRIESVLNPYWNFSAQYFWNINPEIALKPGLFYQKMGDTYHNYGINSMFTYRNNFGIGFGYLKYPGLDLMLKFYDLKLEKSAFDIGLSFTVQNKFKGSQKFLLQFVYKPGFFSE